MGIASFDIADNPQDEIHHFLQQFPLSSDGIQPTAYRLRRDAGCAAMVPIFSQKEHQHVDTNS